MARIIVFSLCLGAMLWSVSPSTAQTPSKDTNFIDKKGRRQGLWIQIDTNGVSYQGQFKDHQPYGTFRYFDKENRTLMTSEFFRQGYASKTTFFYPDGKRKAQGYYLDKAKDSLWSYYGPSGELLKEESYQNGMLNGMARLYDKDKQLIETQMWYRGLRHGKWWEKSDKGTQTTTYKLNMSHGKYLAHFPNDSLYIDGEYIDGRKEGTWTFYLDNGQPEKFLYYRRNVLLKKEVAIKVDEQLIRLSTDTVVLVQTNGKQCLIRLDNGGEYRCVTDFSQLLKAFDTDDFLLANAKVLVGYKYIRGMQALPDEEVESHVASSLPQRALLLLKIDYPYDIVLDPEAIGIMQNIRSSKAVEDEE